MNSSQAVAGARFTSIQNCSFWPKSFDPEQVKQVYWSYIFTCTVCSIMAIPTTILNLLVVIAIYRTQCLHRPYNVYLVNLAVSDFVIGFLGEPLYVASVILEIKGDVTWYCVMGAVTALVSYTTAGVSLLTLAAMSVDRFLSINYPLEYRTRVTSSRVGIVTLLLWSLCATGSSMRMYVTVKVYFFALSCVILVPLVVIFVAYIKAFQSLKVQRQKILQRMQLHKGQDEIKLARSRKFLITMLYVLGLVLLCYVPFGCVAVQTVMNGVTSTTRASWNVTDSIGYMNSSLNPVLYCLRIPDIAKAVKTVIISCFQNLSGNVASKVTRVTPTLSSKSDANRNFPTIPEGTPTDFKNTSTGITTSL